MPEHPVAFANQLKQLVELHRVAELAMKDMIVRLWLAEAIPSCYFGLMKKLVDACPRLDVIKRSVCIEGMHLAFFYCKVWWEKAGRNQVRDRGAVGGQGAPHT